MTAVSPSQARTAVAPLARFKYGYVHSDVSAEASEAAWRGPITSLQVLQQYIQSQFQASSASESAPGLSSTVDQALYYMQWISGMWAYGNAVAFTAPGAVGLNEVVGTIPRDQLTLQNYLSSPIGACTDYAQFLAVVLSLAGIDNRIVTLPGHIFNEAKLDGTWWTLDATTNTAIKGSWDQVVDPTNSLMLYHFDDAGMQAASPTYRQVLSQFYTQHLTSSAAGVSPGAYRWGVVYYLDSAFSSNTLYTSLNLDATKFTGGGLPAQAIPAVPSLGGYTTRQFYEATSFAMTRMIISEVHRDVSDLASAVGWRTGIDTIGELQNYVEGQFEALYASTAVQDISSEANRALFYMQWVSGLWKYDAAAVNSPPTVQNLLSLPTATDKDFASVLAALLSDGGFTNRVVEDAGHVLNEVQLGSGWWTLDPTLDVAYQASWGDTVDTYQKSHVLEFDSAGMEAGSPIWSANLGNYLQRTLNTVADGSLSSFDQSATTDYLGLLPDAALFAEQTARSGSLADSGSWTPASHGADAWSVGDFNGDGRDDIFTYNPGAAGVGVELSNGSAFGGAQTWSRSAQGVGSWYVGDFNGDGKDDIFTYSPGTSGALVQLSSGSSFGVARSWTGASWGNGWYVGDFDGDGKSDIFRYVPGKSGADMFLSTGTSFEAAGSWTSAGLGRTRWLVGDFDGDGRDDIAAVSGSIKVYLSTGSSFVNGGVWSAGSPAGATWTVGDMDGDGKADLIANVPGQNQTEVYLSTGSKFLDSGNWTTASSGMDGWYGGDFDGNGRSDLFSYQPGQSGAQMYLGARAQPALTFAGITGHSDVFSFSNFGNDTITNFDATSVNHDIIHLSKALFPDFAAVIDATTQVGGSAVIERNATASLTLPGVPVASLTAGNFTFE